MPLLAGLLIALAVIATGAGGYWAYINQPKMNVFWNLVLVNSGVIAITVGATGLVGLVIGVFGHFVIGEPFYFILSTPMKFAKVGAGLIFLTLPASLIAVGVAYWNAYRSRKAAQKLASKQVGET